jgi:hypothetical protein
MTSLDTRDPANTAGRPTCASCGDVEALHRIGFCDGRHLSGGPSGMLQTCRCRGGFKPRECSGCGGPLTYRYTGQQDPHACASAHVPVRLSPVSTDREGTPLMPGQHAKPQTGFRMTPALKDAATRKAREDGGPGSLNAAVERLLQGWVDGLVSLPDLTLEQVREAGTSSWPSGQTFREVGSGQVYTAAQLREGVDFREGTTFVPVSEPATVPA